MACGAEEVGGDVGEIGVTVGAETRFALVIFHDNNSIIKADVVSF